MRKKLLFLLLALSLCLSLHITALATTSNANTIVYVTNSGEKYHLYGCRYLSRSCNEVTLEYAVINDKTPCSICKPPVPNFTPLPADDTEQIDDEISASGTSNTNSSKGSSGKHYANSSSSNRSDSGDGRSVMSTGDAGILLLIACAGYGVLRLFNKKPKETYRPSSKSAADLYRVPLGTSSLQRESKPPIPPDPPIPGMPDDTTLGLTGLPREKNCNGTAPWGDKYTVWYSKNGSKYHTFWCEWRSDIPVNVVNIDREPCRVCRPKLPDLEWYYKYKSTISAVNDSASAPSDEGAVSKAD